MYQVPPYARAGLYKQLATLKDLVREFREDYIKNASLRPVIAAQMEQAGLYEDLPYRGGGGDEGVLTAEEAEKLPSEGEVRREGRAGGGTDGRTNGGREGGRKGGREAGRAPPPSSSFPAP